MSEHRDMLDRLAERKRELRETEDPVRGPSPSAGMRREPAPSVGRYVAAAPEREAGRPLAPLPPDRAPKFSGLRIDYRLIGAAFAILGALGALAISIQIVRFDLSGDGLVGAVAVAGLGVLITTIWLAVGTSASGTE